jgi:hypothetical protein
MRGHGISHFLTLNPRHFTRYEGITCLNPATP